MMRRTMPGSAASSTFPIPVQPSCSGSCSRQGASPESRSGNSKGLRSRPAPPQFSGQEFMAAMSWGLIFSEGGHLVSVETGGRMTAIKGDPSIGRWQVEDDELCLDFGQGGPRCYAVWASGKNIQLRREGEEPQD